jgi:hypothetical protein
MWHIMPSEEFGDGLAFFKILLQIQDLLTLWCNHSDQMTGPMQPGSDLAQGVTLSCSGTTREQCDEITRTENLLDGLPLIWLRLCGWKVIRI